MAASEVEGQTDSPKMSVENITDDESSESDHEELEQAYEKLYKESLNLFKLNDKLTKKLKACESENVKLKEEISEARINAIKVADDRQLLSFCVLFLIKKKMCACSFFLSCFIFEKKKKKIPKRFS
ncbi:hypothetical protein CsSME_00047085 [Camellia sinensis var. sinensis]